MEYTPSWLKIGGLILLILSISIAAFALGVYFGKYGFSDAGLGYRPEGQPQAGQPPPDRGVQNQIPPGLPPGRPQVIGRIQYIGEQSLRLATQDGPRIILLTQDTKIYNRNGEAISLRDLHNGEVIGVYGAFTNGDGTQLHANTLILLPPPPNQQP